MSQLPPIECDKECRFAFGMECTTCAYYAPVYDKQGNNTNPDRNVTYGNCVCTTCSKRWEYRTQYGKTTWEAKE